ncbi:non-ribosomal peptide synthetase [Herbaspirillum rubrisubalbicans]|nr:non-ribosomal peptide synthetase [Herbaspirillum rubrisubalbicans]
MSPLQRQAALTMLRAKGLLPDAGPAAYALEQTQAQPDQSRAPLSYAQQRLWFLWQLDPASPAYNLSNIIDLQGPLNLPALERTLASLVARHAALRTHFAEQDGQAWQCVADPGPVVLPVEGTLDTPLTPQHAAELARHEAHRPFDLQHGPLLRARLLVLGPQMHQLLLTMHHSISDGWSLALLPDELRALYAHHAGGAPLTLAPLPLQYPQYAAWQRRWMEQGERARQLDYWTRQLGGHVTRLELPSDRPRATAQGDAGAHHYFSLTPDVSDRIKSFCQTSGVTLAMFLLACFKAVLYRHSGQQDIWIGVPNANRPHPETEAMLGFFVNTQVLRTDLTGAPSFDTLLCRVRDNFIQAQQHQDLPFDQLVEALNPQRSAKGNPLFDAKFTMMVPIERHWQGGGLAFTMRDSPVLHSHFELSLDATDLGAHIDGCFTYATALFDADRIARLAAQLTVFADEAAAHSDRSIDQIALLGPQQQQQLVEWSTGPDPALQVGSVLQMFQAMAMAHPEQTALSDATQQLSYAQLEQAATSLAHTLIEAGVTTETPVAVCAPRSADLVVGMLAVMKAGGIHVPLDPELPAARLRGQLADCGARIVLGAPQHLSWMASQPEGLVCLSLAGYPQAAVQPSGLPALPLPHPQQAAYIIYTSGSTGRPKGVVVSHAALANYTGGLLQRLAAKEPLAMAMVSTPAADLGHTVLFGALCGGHTLHLLAPQVCFDPDAFAAYLRQCHIGVLKIVPSHLSALLHAADAQGALPWHTLIIGGETAPVELLHQLRTLRPECRVINHYGPTETTVGVLTHVMDKLSLPATPLPVGMPLPGMRASILDAHLQRLPPGVPGELYLGGVGVARGYHGRADLSAERFVPDPFTDSGERLYRTGDRARYRSDGSIEFLGRADDQVKIRGYRVEPGEVAQVLRGLTGVDQAVVVTLADEHEPDKLRLHAYYTAGAPDAPQPAALQDALQALLPDYMQPASLQRLNALPLTANGKLDRQRLPRFASPLAEAVGAAKPRNPLEETLAAIWAEVLKCEQIGIHDNFFALGGDSILSLQIIARARKRGIKLSPRQIFEQQSIAALAQGLHDKNGIGEGATRQAPVTVPRADRSRALPMSHAQERLWLLWALDPQSRAYNLTQAMHWRGQLNVAALQSALDALVARHESLRTVFIPAGTSARQHVHAAADAQLVLAHDTLPPDLPDSALPALRERLDRLPFDLTQGPLLRALLLARTGEQGNCDDHVLVLSMHHICGDGWSLNLLYEELVLAYQAACAGRLPDWQPLPIQYADYAAWQHQAQTQTDWPAQRNYWLARLNGADALPALPYDHPRPTVRSGAGAWIRRRIPHHVTSGLRILARNADASLSMALLSSFALLLRHHGAAADLTIGMPVANRRWQETEALIGFFVNMLALRIDTASSSNLQGLLAHVRNVVLDAQQHQDLPFEQVVAALQPARSMAHTPLFQVVFNHQVRHVETLRRLPGLDISLLDTTLPSTKFDLSLHTSEIEDELNAVFEYSTDLFDATTIDRMADQWLLLLEGMVADPAARISDLPLQDATTRQALLQDWNPQQVDHPEQACLHTLIEAQAAHRPHAMAVDQLSYDQLNRRANRLAHRLIQLGAGPERLVGVAMERGPDLIITLLAVLKAGAAYLPLDPAYPPQRLAYMIDDAQPVLVLSENGIDLPVNTVQGINLSALDLSAEPESNPSNQSVPGNLAYCIYTSGSTGQPKGALLTHRHVTRLFQSTAGQYHFGPEDVWTLFHSYAFDFSVWEIFGALLHGGRLVVVPHLVSRSPQDFHRLLLEQGVTVLNQTPSAFRQLIPEALSTNDAGRLRLVIFGGDALDTGSLQPWFDAFDDHQPQLVNMYGITETTVHVSYRPITIDDCRRSVSPIGAVLDDLSWYVLDDALNPVPPGVTGELYIGGAGLARGYLGRPALTAQRFIPNPFGSGRLYRTGDQARWHLEEGMQYLGRNDRQVKLRGFRIELGEIEAALKAQPGVTDAVVLIHQGAAGEQLVAYLVAPSDLARDGLRAALATRLPDYMLPAHYMLLDQFPLTANGKLDRQQLPPPEAVQDQYVAPEGPIETALAAIWQEVLGVERVGATDNFFELGGHSLLATQVVARVSHHLGANLPLRAVFEAPQLGALAALVTPGNVGPGIIAQDRHQAPLSPLQQRLWFLWQLAPGSTAYHITRRFSLSARLHPAALEHAVLALAQRQAMLRTRFEQHDGLVQQDILTQAVVRPQWHHAADRQNALDWLEQQAQMPFDLTQGPAWRIAVAETADAADGVQYLQISLHHIVADARTVQLLIQELTALYRGDTLLPLPVQYADYADWQQQWLAAGHAQRQLHYWQQALAGLPEQARLPTDHVRPRQPSHRGGQLLLRLPAPLARSVLELARRAGATPFMAQLALFQCLLWRLGGQADVAVGVPVVNRPRLETEGLVGCFLNTQVMRTQIDGAGSLWALLAQVREVVMQAQSHQELPFEQLVEVLQPARSLDRHPLFQVAFDYRQADATLLPHLGQAALQEMPRAHVIAKFDLELALQETSRDELQASFTYAEDLFEAATIGRLSEYWQQLLEAVVANPDAPLDALPLLPAAELAQIQQANASAMDYPRTACLHQLIEQRVHERAAEIALIMDHQHLTHGELQQRANSLAVHLQALGVGPDVLVGVAMPRGPIQIISLLAILKAGGAYLPLDPAYPAQRLADMANDAQPLLLLTQSSVNLPPMAGQRLIIDDLPELSTEVVTSTVTPANLAYCIYTSGSTGKPKGVMISHGNLVNFLYTMAQAPGLTRDDRILGLTSLSFDIAGLEIWLPLLQGAQLVLSSRDQAQDPRQLLALIAQHDISVIQATPSTWRMLSEQDNLTLLHGRTLLCGGEALPADLAARLLATGAHVWNVYGPTETTIWSARQLLTIDAPKPLLGGPIGNTQLHVLDAAMQVCAANVVGELYIGGDGVARGYRGRPGLTAERFIPDPCSAPGARLYRTGDLARRLPDGAIDYVGRIDDQVKLRGFRIELGEIEAHLLAHAEVRQAVVVLREGRLVAYLVTDAGFDQASLQQQLAACLPDYMLPTQWVRLEQLPLTANGKIDRKQLPLVALEHEAFIAPAGPTETAIATIWQDVLGVPQVGASDNFFALGGHSLLATRVMARVQRQLQVSLPLQVFFELLTPAQLARHIDSLTSGAVPDSAQASARAADLLAALEQ